MKSFKELQQSIYGIFNEIVTTLLDTVTLKHIEYNSELSQVLEDMWVYRDKLKMVHYVKLYELLTRYNHTDNSTSTSIIVKGFADHLHNINVEYTMLLDVLYRHFNLTNKIAIPYNTSRSAFYIFKDVETLIRNNKPTQTDYIFKLISEDDTAAGYVNNKETFLVLKGSKAIESRETFGFSKADAVALIYSYL